MDVRKVYELLLCSYGPQGWWPVRKAGYHPSNSVRDLSEQELLEICIGAILTQNTNWRNVERALEALFSAGLIDLKKLAHSDETQISELIRSSGYFRQKARKLKLFASHMAEKHGSLKSFFGPQNTIYNLPSTVCKLRTELLSLWGVGPETADSMLLYAGRRPIFVIDAYTKRIMSRLGFCEPGVSYEELQRLFHYQLSTIDQLQTTRLYAEYHALLVEHAKRFCTKSAPKCGECPLRETCKNANRFR